jgi:hypothetical protein
LLLFGVGMGISYFATLYYSLSVGHGTVDAGEAEALVGLGYARTARGPAGQAFGSGANTVTVVLTVCALAGVFCCPPVPSGAGRAWLGHIS